MRGMKRSMNKTCYPCHIFDMPDAEKGYCEFRGKIIQDYGDDVCLPDGTKLHENYTWDDGSRRLLRCEKCGGLILVQTSEFHNMYDGPDGYYQDWIPAASAEEADLLNILLDVMELEDYPCRHLRRNNGQVFWTAGEEPKPKEPEELRKQIREKYPLVGVEDMIGGVLK